MISYIEDTVLQLDTMDNLEMYYQKKERLIQNLKTIEFPGIWQNSFAISIKQWGQILDMRGKMLEHNLEMRKRSKNKIYYKRTFGKKMVHNVIFALSLYVQHHSLLPDEAPQETIAPVIKMHK